MATLRKQYIFKVSRAGTFLGNLYPAQVTLPFSYVQQVNTAAASATIQVAINPFRANLAVQPIETEAGQPLQTEAGDTITTEGAPDIYGSANASILLRTNNDVEVVEFSANYPNGKTIFKGYITFWEAELSARTAQVTINLISHGTDLNNSIITAGGGTPVLENLVEDGSTFNTSYSDKISNEVIQSFAGTNATVGSLKFKAQSTGGATIYAGIFQMFGSNPAGYPTDTQIGFYASVDVPAGASSAVYTINFPASFNIVSGVTYYIRWVIATGLGTSALIYGSAANPYASGQAWTELSDGLGETFTSVPGSDIYFGLYAPSSTTSTFVGTEPIAMLRSIIDDSVAKGGSVNYASGSTDVTTNSVSSYSFNTNTTLEGITKALQFCPSTWYWYTDPATDILYAKQTATTATHKLMLGRHLVSFKIRSTVENVANQIYYTGGQTGGVNLFKVYTSTTSITNMAGRVLMQRLSDNKALVANTLDVLGNNALARHPNEEYNMWLRVFDNKYDTRTFKLGDTATVSGNGNFIDSLILQISQISLTPEYADIMLGPLLPETGSDLISTQADITALQTIANPTTPS